MASRFAHPDLLKSLTATYRLYDMAVTVSNTFPAVNEFSDAAQVSSRKRALLLEFIEQTGVSAHFQWNGMNPVLMRKALETVKSWNTGIPDEILEKYIVVGFVIATTGYAHTPLDVQFVIGMYTMCVTMADDSIMTNDMLREFAPRFFEGLPQLHPILTHTVEYLLVARHHYSSYMANAITVSTIDFFSAEMFMRDEGGSDLKVAEASEYVDYLRWKTGVGEGYAAFIWPKVMFPETKTYIQAMP